MTVRVERRSVASIREALYVRPVRHQIDALGALVDLPADHKMWVLTCTNCPALVFDPDWHKTVYIAVNHEHVNHRG